MEVTLEIQHADILQELMCQYGSLHLIRFLAEDAIHKEDWLNERKDELINI